MTNSLIDLSKRSKRYLFSLLSGIFLSLPWLGFPSWILFFALLPLFLVENYFAENQQQYKSVSLWGHAFLSFLLWNSLTTWWICNATKIGVILAILTNTFLMSLAWWLSHAVNRKFKMNLGTIGFVVFWLSFEFFHYHWDIEWPWLSLGNGFANSVLLIQWYEFTGTAGGALWVLTVNILLLKTYIHYRDNHSKKTKTIHLIAILSTVCLPVLVSVIMYSTYTEKQNPRNIVVVQPNIDPYSESYSVSAENQKLEKIIELANQKITDSTNFVIAPETVFERYPDWDEGRLNFNENVMRLTDFIREKKKAELIFGLTSMKKYASTDKIPSSARNRNGVIYDVFNSAFFIGRDGKVQSYHKSKLVVAVEKIPFLKYLPFLGNLIVDLGGTSGSLGSQDDSSVFTSTDNTRVAPVICYESVFGEYLASYVQKGAGLIFIITNDGWWKNTPGYKQHLSFARLRAIETRRSIARSANTGISCFINQRGDISNATQWWVEDAVSSNLNVNDQITFYVKYGDYISRVALFVSAILVMLYIAALFRK